MNAQQDQVYDTLIQEADRLGFQVFSPNGHLNAPIQDQIADEMIDYPLESRIQDPLPLTFRIAMKDGLAPEAPMNGLKACLANNGFDIQTPQPSSLAPQFLFHANGVKMSTAPIRGNQEELVITIEALPA